MKHTPPATEPIVFECDLPHSPALVWRALTDRDLLGAWLLPNDMRPEVGARFSFERADQQPGYSIDCEVLEVEPNRTLRWRQTEAGDPESGWRSVTSVVTIELTDNAAGGTHLRLVHGEFTLVSAALYEPLTAPKASATVIRWRSLSSTKARNLGDIVCQLRRAA
ncbi:MAG: ATPase [Gammaproteobacteria bacterium]|nr:ATPase [Gammaproteobacteria bacterium]